MTYHVDSNRNQTQQLKRPAPGRIVSPDLQQRLIALFISALPLLATVATIAPRVRF